MLYIVWCWKIGKDYKELSFTGMYNLLERKTIHVVKISDMHADFYVGNHNTSSPKKQQEVAKELLQ